MFALRMLAYRPRVANLQMILDGNRILEHKKYQMNNQVQLSQATRQPPSKYLEKNEVAPKNIQIETRILKLLHESNLVDISDFSFSEDIRKEYYLDSLDITALVSSIEE